MNLTFTPPSSPPSPVGRCPLTADGGVESAGPTPATSAESMTPPSAAPTPPQRRWGGDAAEPLFDLHGFPTPAGRAWLAAQPLPAPPPPEPAESVRARMASEIARAVSATGCVTERDLARAGFSAAEIAEHLAAAVRQSGATRMVA